MSDQLPRQFGPYSLLKLLAKGGMGEIYLARTAGISAFEKYYAVKRLLKKFAHDTDVSARFIDEAKLGARLQHPNIVQVYDLGKVTEELYMATEFVDGFDLRRVLRFCHEKKKRIPLDIALFIVREVLSGLAYAHRQLDADGKSINLIHRDISPQNVLVSFEGEVKIIDFGLAKSTQRSQETQANVLLGNFGYMSPEQARGQRLDVRTDVYSCGIVLFELVTGTKRFVDENPLRLLEMVARPTPIMPSDRAPDIPKAIDRIYAGATVAQREGRYDDAEGFRDEVTQALHRLNPRATREHLAQFLNHLFLGGAAPPEVDNDALNKSVAMQIKDLHEGSEAFTKTIEDDVQDRGLTDFDDEASQTDSHTLMRAARVGDNLSHQEITGDSVDPPEVSANAPPRPPGREVQVDHTGSSPHARAPMPPPPVAAAPPAGLDSTPGAMSLDSQLPSPAAAISTAATSVYEAPTFPTPEATAPPPPSRPDPRSQPPRVPEEPIAPPPPAMPEPQPTTPALESIALEELELQSIELEELELEPLELPSMEVSRPAPEPAVALEPLAPSAPTVTMGAVSSAEGAVVSTLAPRPQEPELEESTMVVDFDSLPGAHIDDSQTERHVAFGEGGGHDSLIIDFDVESLDEEPTERAAAAPRPRQAVQPLPGTPMPPPEPPPVAQPLPAPPVTQPTPAPVAPQEPAPAKRPRSQDGAPPGGPQPVIRPAAQPRGRVATGGVARNRPRGEPPSGTGTPPKSR